MAQWFLTNNAKLRMAKGNWNVDTATLKCALFLSTSNLGATSTTFAGVTNPHATANGYPAGGVSCDFSFDATAPAAPKVIFTSNPQFTASGGSIVARKSAIYEVSGDVYAYKDFDGTDVTVTSGNTLTIDNDGVPDSIVTVGP